MMMVTKNDDKSVVKLKNNVVKNKVVRIKIV